MIQVYSKYLCKSSKLWGFMWGQELPVHYALNLDQIKYLLSSHICHKPPVSSFCLLHPLCPSKFLVIPCDPCLFSFQCALLRRHWMYLPYNSALYTLNENVWQNQGVQSLEESKDMGWGSRSPFQLCLTWLIDSIRWFPITYLERLVYNEKEKRG